MIYVYVGECGVRFEKVKSHDEGEYRAENNENYQEVTAGEISVIIENLLDIQGQINKV